MRYQAGHKKLQREHILDAATKLVLFQGPTGWSIRDVMGLAGLTHGGFYAHFPSRDALIAAAIENAFKRRLPIHAPPSSAAAARKKLASFADEYLSARHIAQKETGCPVAALLSEAPRLPPAARTAFAQGADQLVDHLAVLAERAGFSDPVAHARRTLGQLVTTVALERLRVASRADPAS